MKIINNKYTKDLIIFIIPLLIFTLIFNIYYPGIIPFDGNNQWQQVQTKIITNAHPFFSTYFMYLLSKIWNDPKIVIFFQIIIFSFFWMIMCRNTRKDNFIKQILYTVFISFIPIISLYSITLWKDVLYSYYMMMLAFITYQIGRDNEVKKSQWKDAFLF